MTKTAERVVMVLSIAALGCLSGCDGVRSLSAEEQKYYQALHDRMQSNEKNLIDALDRLGDIYENQVRYEREDMLSALAKAKLLESLKSTWAHASPAMLPTQRSVAYFHLYELAQAEETAMQSDFAEKARARQAVREAYGKMLALLDSAIADQKVLLEYLNQPASAHISEFVGNATAEAQAFQKELATSKDEQLRKLAEDTQKAIDRAAEAQAALASLTK